MYNGIKKKEKFNHKKIKIDTKCQIITEEEIETNGIIRKQLVVKTIDYKANPNIKYTDFEINNLIAAGIDVNSLNTITHTPNREKQIANADAANKTLEQLEIIKAIENDTKETRQETTETNG